MHWCIVWPCLYPRVRGARGQALHAVRGRDPEGGPSAPGGDDDQCQPRARSSSDSCRKARAGVIYAQHTKRTGRPRRRSLESVRKSSTDRPVRCTAQAHGRCVYAAHVRTHVRSIPAMHGQWSTYTCAVCTLGRDCEHSSPRSVTVAIYST